MDEPFELVAAPDSLLSGTSKKHHPGPPSLLPDYEEHSSAKVADTELTLTVSLASNAPLLAFAGAGFAKAELDTKTDHAVRWRAYVPAAHRGGQDGLGDATFYAKYTYTWGDNQFLLFTVGSGYNMVQYLLKEPDESKGETVSSHNAISDGLIYAAGKAVRGDAAKFVYVYDGYLQASVELYNQVQKASWDKVILADAEKKELAKTATNFFDSEKDYKQYGVPWRRGLIFYGPPGNGKTISLKAIMHQLYSREVPVPTLYVKSARYTFNIGEIFRIARSMSPCLLVMEDIETIVTSETRSYFFNEVDGLESNDGILMIASTNYLDRLDSGLAKRPSRFDRKYLFPLPDRSERVAYCKYWKSRLAKSNKDLEFPDEIFPAVADITDGFSFAFLQEAFVSALLALARGDVTVDEAEPAQRLELNGLSLDAFAEHFYRQFTDEVITRAEDKDPLDKVPLWHALKKSIGALRKDLKDGDGKDDASSMRDASHLPRPPPGRRGGPPPDPFLRAHQGLEAARDESRVAAPAVRASADPTTFGYPSARYCFGTGPDYGHGFGADKIARFLIPDAEHEAAARAPDPAEASAQAARAAQAGAVREVDASKVPPHLGKKLNLARTAFESV